MKKWPACKTHPSEDYSDYVASRFPWEICFALVILSAPVTVALFVLFFF